MVPKQRALPLVCVVRERRPDRLAPEQRPLKAWAGPNVDGQRGATVVHDLEAGRAHVHEVRHREGGAPDPSGCSGRGTAPHHCETDRLRPIRPRLV